MKTPTRVKKAMRMLGMKASDDLQKVVARNEKELIRKNNAVKQFNNKVYANKLKLMAEEKKAVNAANVAAYQRNKENLNSVAKIVQKYENLKIQKMKNKGEANEGNTLVKRMARQYNAKIKA